MRVRGEKARRRTNSSTREAGAGCKADSALCLGSLQLLDQRPHTQERGREEEQTEIKK